MNKVTLSVPTELTRRAKAKAALLGTSLSAVIRDYLKAWVKEEPALPLEEPQDYPPR